MATTSDHLRQWRHNRELVSRIPPTHPDWIVTISFYTALHAIDALLAADKISRIVSHTVRNSVLTQTNKYSYLAKVFLPLYDLSQTVRYLADPAAWIPFDCVEREVFGRYLYPIESSVMRLLKSTEMSVDPIKFAS